MKKIKLLFAAVAMTLVLAACGTNEPANNATNDTTGGTNQAAEVTPEATTEAGYYPITVSPTVGSAESEDKGTIQFADITFEKAPEKIVVFDYGFLDTLTELNVEGIVGVVNGASLPSHLKQYADEKYASIGNLKTPDFEAIAALEPDVIFISGRQSAFFEELSEIAPVLFVGTDQNAYWDTFVASVHQAGKIFNKEAEVEAYLTKYDDKLAQIKELATKYDTSLVTMYNEGKLSGFATESRFGYIYQIYGFKPVTEDIKASSHGSDFGFEAVLEFNPQVLFVIDRTAATSGAESTIEQDLQNEIIAKTDAYKNNRIIYLDGPLWYTSGGGLSSELAKIDEILTELTN